MFSNYSSHWTVGSGAESPVQPYAHGVQPISGLSAARSESQGSLASSATSSPSHRTLLFPSATSLG